MASNGENINIIPPGVLASRLNVSLYFLVCHCFDRHHNDLLVSLSARPRSAKDMNSCIDALRSALAVAYDYPSKSLPVAAKKVVGQLASLVNLFDTAPAVTQVLEEFTATMDAMAPTWDYSDTLAAIFRLGRNLSRDFYQPSPHPITRARIQADSRDLEVDFTTQTQEYMKAGARAIRLVCRDTFGYREYLMLVFGFLHEFSAHVHGVDPGGTRVFYDGWMKFAAERHLKQTHQCPITGVEISKRVRTAWTKPQNMELEFEQRGYDLADLLSVEMGVERFQRFTWDLAACEPKPGMPDNYPGRLLTVIDEEMAVGQGKLLRRLQRYKSLADLHRYLTQRSTLARRAREYPLVYPLRIAAWESPPVAPHAVPASASYSR